jgi:hypothetical protein
MRAHTMRDARENSADENKFFDWLVQIDNKINVMLRAYLADQVLKIVFKIYERQYNQASYSLSPLLVFSFQF